MKTSNRITERDQHLKERLEEVGGDDYTFVYMSITSEQYGDEERYMLVIQSGTEWLVWGKYNWSQMAR